MPDIALPIALVTLAALAVVVAVIGRTYYRARERHERRRAAEGVEAARVRIKARSYRAESWRQD